MPPPEKAPAPTADNPRPTADGDAGPHPALVPPLRRPSAVLASLIVFRPLEGEVLEARAVPASIDPHVTL